MPQLQNLVLTDRAGTPVNHTFTPESINPKTGVASVVKSSGVPVGDRRFSISTRKSAERRRVSMRLVYPIVATQTVNGVDTPVVVRTAYANVDFNFDKHSTTQERKDTIAMVESSLGASKTLVNGAVVDLEGIY